MYLRCRLIRNNLIAGVFPQTYQNHINFHSDNYIKRCLFHQQSPTSTSKNKKKNIDSHSFISKHGFSSYLSKFIASQTKVCKAQLIKKGVPSPAFIERSSFNQIQSRNQSFLNRSTMAANGAAVHQNGNGVAFSGPPRHAPAMYSIPIEQPVVTLDAKSAFQNLTEREQLYAHHLSRASFYGGLIVLLQTSPESPLIYRLIQLVNAAQTVEEHKISAIKDNSITAEDFHAYLVYCSGVFTNMGNYKGFGDSKMVPDLTPEQFEAILHSSALYKAGGEGKVAIDEIWSVARAPIFSLTEKSKQLGLGKKGVTKYFSSNCDENDADIVNRFFKAKKIEGYNNRVIKTTSACDGRPRYEIRNAGVANSVLLKPEEFEGAEFLVTSGDYDKLLEKVAVELENAGKYVANENEKKMLEGYISSFRDGSLDKHKDGSRHWIKNKGPAVETYIGFIETYRDPVGMRAEFEGFVAMVNREQSKKFQELVDKAEQLLPLLPWPKDFEKDTFLRPDFTSLDVLVFGGSGIPAGINIPNYDEIRQSEGFKNVNLGNVISSSYKADKKSPFVTQEDHELLEEHRVQSFEVQVGLHELLGHGSGKLLQAEDACGSKFNFKKGELMNPLTNTPVDKWYEEGETYDQKFTSTGSSYEECRAECVGLFLSCNRDVLKIFGHTEPAKQDDIVYVNWLSLCHAAVRGIEMYSPGSSEWKQAHSQARFVILQVLIDAGQGFVSVKAVTGDDGKPDLLLTMDRTKVESVGKPAIGDFLQKIQVYKSTGDIDAARKMYDAYSAVDDERPGMPWGSWRDIVLDRKQPRKMMVQANTKVEDEKLRLVEYAATHEGMMESWRDRFSLEEHAELETILKALYEKDQEHFQFSV